MPLRRPAIVLLLALLTWTAGNAEDQNWEQANMLLVKATELETFKPDPHPKFQINVKFVFHHTSEGNLQGTYVRDFVLAERWKDEIVVGKFVQSRVRIDKQIWTKKTEEFAPIQVDTLFKALFSTKFQMVQSDIVDRVHNKKLDNVEGRCIEFHNVVGNSRTAGEICVDRVGGQIVYWKYGSREIWYTDYANFEGALRPMRFVVNEENNKSIEADVKYAEAPELTSNAFAPLQSAEITEVCNDSRGVIRKDAPDPMFPPSLSRRQFPQDVVVKAEIDETGHVTKAAVVESVHPILDGQALNAVKHWLFEPKLCDGHAVSSSTRLNVHFR